MKSTRRKKEPAAQAAAPEQHAAAGPAEAGAPRRAAKEIEAAVAPSTTPARVVVLASHCNVKDAAALKASLCAVLDHSEPVTIDVSAVERIDTATMQLLCAFARERGAARRAISWAGESKALREAAKLLGAAAMLAMPEMGAAA